MTTVLALDLATVTGWAISRTGMAIQSGRLTMIAGGRQGQRLKRFHTFLVDIKNRSGGIDFVTWEDAWCQPGIANQVHHNLVGVLLNWCEHHGIGYKKIAVATIKKHATGSGRAKKPDMIAAARAKGFNVIDDNEADALHLLFCALETLPELKGQNNDISLSPSLALDREK